MPPGETAPSPFGLPRKLPELTAPFEENVGVGGTMTSAPEKEMALVPLVMMKLASDGLLRAATSRVRRSRLKPLNDWDLSTRTEPGRRTTPWPKNVKFASLRVASNPGPER